MWSVEWVPKDDTYNCWNQLGLVNNKFMARWMRFEFVLGNFFKHHKTRIREV